MKEILWMESIAKIKNNEADVADKTRPTREIRVFNSRPYQYIAKTWLEILNVIWTVIPLKRIIMTQITRMKRIKSV